MQMYFCGELQRDLEPKMHPGLQSSFSSLSRLDLSRAEFTIAAASFLKLIRS